MVEDECGLGVVDPELVRRGDKVRILHHQPKDFTTEARFSEKDFEVSLGNSALSSSPIHCCLVSQFDEQKDKLFVVDDERGWDGVGCGFEAGEELWAAGGGNETDHIHPADNLDRKTQPFVRYDSINRLLDCFQVISRQCVLQDSERPANGNPSQIG